jgi:two-component system OmpR family response regulator
MNTKNQKVAVVTKIAMVEDDLELAEILIEYLKRYNIKVTNFDDPYSAVSAIGLDDYDLIILDLTLPGMDGLELCKKLIEKYEIPIIISSARSDITDKVTALEIGADDYLPKPYDPRELEVRIKTILRRYNKELKQNNQKDEIFKLDMEKQEITKNGKFIKFTPAEFEIMTFLIQKKGFIVNRYELIDNSNFMNSDEGGSIAVIINRIRHKIEENPKKPQFLQTIRGIGYKLVE